MTKMPASTSTAAPAARPTDSRTRRGHNSTASKHAERAYHQTVRGHQFRRRKIRVLDRGQIRTLHAERHHVHGQRRSGHHRQHASHTAFNRLVTRGAQPRDGEYGAAHQRVQAQRDGNEGRVPGDHRPAGVGERHRDQERERCDHGRSQQHVQHPLARMLGELVEPMKTRYAQEQHGRAHFVR